MESPKREKAKRPRRLPKSASSATVSRPRVRSEDVPATVADRVSHIADLMACGQYRTRMTVRELAGVWGVAENTVTNLASEAHRLLLTPPEEIAGRRAELAAWFEAVAAFALQSVSRLTGLPDTTSAIKAKELYGKYAGLEPTDAAASQAARPFSIVVQYPKDVEAEAGAAPALVVEEQKPEP